MKILISPAKSLDFDSKVETSLSSKPIFTDQANQINDIIKDISMPDLSNLMSISPKLSELNWSRNQDFKNNNSNEKEAEESPKKISSKNIIFGCTGTIGEIFPHEKISNNIPNLIKKITYTQNKFIWMKAALAIMTTDTKPKLAMEECYIGSEKVKIYGIAKGSGMIHPNMATTTNGRATSKK